MRENLNEYDRFSGLDREKRKPSFLIVMLVALLVLLVCSLGYDNIVKPYLANKKQQTEKQIEPSPQESEELTASEPEEIESDETDAIAEDVNEEPVPCKERPSTEQANNVPTPDPIQPEIEQNNNPADVIRQVYPEQPKKNVASTPSKSEDYSNLSTLEILERQNHADVVRQARRAGVSTEGTTLEIMERINHADVVRQARRAGVSTDGTTLEIMERINRKELQRMGY